MSTNERMDWQKLLNASRRRQSRMPDDDRAQFERDYDRTIFSTPVKRLQDKAQVFPLEPNDAIRTRLTHSLEVAAVARGLATSAGAWLHKEGEILLEQQRWVEAIASTCGLIHDLGNPPFGHAGEDAIREWFVPHIPGRDEAFIDPQLSQDFLNFEGNAQTLRIVSKLQILADFYGLNLTFGTLSAACKYTAASHQAKKGNQALKKPGYFASESDVIKEVREATGTGDARNPITFLVEAADDIVYSVADIEDAVKKNLLRWSDLLERFEPVIDPAKSHPAKEALVEVLRRKWVILGRPGQEAEKSMDDDTHGSAFRTAAISYMVPEAVDAFKSNYDDIMHGIHLTELVAHPSLVNLMTELKAIGSELIYPNHSTVKLELMGRRIISDLMTIFWEGAKDLPLEGKPKTKDFKGRVGALLSRNYRSVFQESCRLGKQPEIYHRYQLVTDYVCGMTDTFAKQLHSELMNG